MARPLSDLTYDVTAQCPKTPEPLVALALRDAAIAFFQDTRVKRMTLDPILVAVDQATYVLTNPNGQQIIGVRYAEIDGVPCRATSEETLDREWQEMFNGFPIFWLNGQIAGAGDAQSWRTARSDRSPWHYLEDPNLLRLVGIPNVATDATAGGVGLVVNVYVHPTDVTTEIDEWLFNTHKQTLVAKALADLMAMPGKAWTNAGLSRDFLAYYDQKSGELRDQALRGHHRNDEPIRRTKVWN